LAGHDKTEMGHWGELVTLFSILAKDDKDGKESFLEVIGISKVRSALSVCILMVI
jgi:hypothetical protein